MSNLDLDAIESAGATLTCCRDRCSICGRKSWCGGHAMGDSACTRPGSIECRAVAAVRTLRADLAARDNLIADLRCCLAAARLDAANARSVAVEALALLDARLNTRTLEGYVFKDEAEAQAATLRARLDASDFAARATAAIDKYGEAERDLGYDARDAVPDDGNAPFPVDADKQQARDAARAEVLAVIGVGRG